MKILSQLWHDESGATAIEYGLLIVIMVIGIIASVQTIGANYVVGPMNNVQTHLVR